MLAATVGVPRRGIWVGLGVAGGVAGACLSRPLPAKLANLFEGLRPGAVQRRDPDRRGDDAHLAQCLDGRARPRDGPRHAPDGRGGHHRPAHADGAGGRGGRRCAARGARRSCCSSTASRHKAACRPVRC
ncbi:MAG: hypothetical protein WDM81_04440 [Rhizomicrobium sp.]